MELNNLTLDSFVTEKNSYYGKNQTKYSFPNGYGASVISGEGIRQFEIAVLEADGSLCYNTEITDDVHHLCSSTAPMCDSGRCQVRI